jgi:hypothetical protein
MNAMPMMKNVGKTVPAVRTGCQLGSLEFEISNFETRFTGVFCSLGKYK